MSFKLTGAPVISGLVDKPNARLIDDAHVAMSTEIETEAEAQVEAQAEAQVGAQVEAQVEAQAEAQVEAQAEAEAESTMQAKAEAELAEGMANIGYEAKVGTAQELAQTDEPAPVDDVTEASTDVVAAADEGLAAFEEAAKAARQEALDRSMKRLNLRLDMLIHTGSPRWNNVKAWYKH